MNRKEAVFHYKDRFDLESGERLSRFHLRYTTYGTLNADRSNVVWLVHALTANSDPLEWWPEIVGPSCPIDTQRYFVVCASCLGSQYGSTNPLSVNEETGSPYFHAFPMLTNRDIVRSFDLLRQELGLSKIHTIVGASLGGQQVLEWLIYKKNVFSKAILLATNAKHSPWGIAFNESQRLAIQSDPSWEAEGPDAGLTGLAVARSIALLSYRTEKAYSISQKEQDDRKLADFKASSYQRYQGEKLRKRYNAYSYYRLTQAMDSHNVGRGREGVAKALSSIEAECSIIGVCSDLLFPIKEQRYLQEHIRKSSFYKIESDFGHDGFLTEVAQLSQILRPLLEGKHEVRSGGIAMER